MGATTAAAAVTGEVGVMIVAGAEIVTIVAAVVIAIARTRALAFCMCTGCHVCICVSTHNTHTCVLRNVCA